MSDRPTYNEYAFSRTENVVQTADGLYFNVSTPKFTSAIRVLLYFLFVGLYIWLIFRRSEGFIWPHLMLEAQLFLLLVLQVSNYIGYRLTSFREISADDEDHAEVSAWHYGKPGFSAGKILLVLVLVFLLLNSFSVTYLRSVINHDAQVESINDEAVTEDTQVITVPYNSYDQTLYIQIIRTSQPAEFTFDGMPLENYSRNLLFSWIWEEGYFRQRYELFLDDIHDGSVLNLTCGDITREWVFDVADEEAS